MVELRGQRLVVRQHQRRAVHGLDDLGHGEGLARTGNAEQHLMLLAVAHAARKFVDGGDLIAARAIVHNQPEGGHAFSIRRLALYEG